MNQKSTTPVDPPIVTNFIRNRIDQERREGKSAQIVTRFPPEPNGYLHIGHAKSICVNFGIAKDYSGVCNLRFDDTNPEKEETEYVEAIQSDIRWLGFDWGANQFFASDYFEKIFNCAVELIESGHAYVCSLSADEMRQYRGTLTEPGRASPSRERPVAESLDLFKRMRSGEFQDGAYVLRAKIDMSSPNLNMRDPALYRIRRGHHHRTGNLWCIYPMYDFAHALSDMFEGITHSLCTLEFEDHRPLYDWCLDTLKTPNHPQQIEFARLNLDYTVMSKRKLLELVVKKKVSGWDDPRMPTLQGMRRRGYPAAAIRDFCQRIGVTKKDSVIEFGLLETCVREALDPKVLRVMGVLRPVKLVIENYPEDQVEWLEVPNHPQDPSLGSRKVGFSKTLWIEQDDFMEVPAPKYFRLTPGREVRLRSAYYVTCTGFDRDPISGQVTEIRCTYDPLTKGGGAPDGRKVKATLHWVSQKHAVKSEVRLYDRFFSVPDPGAGDTDYLEQVNPDSFISLKDSQLEQSVTAMTAGTSVQFERQGYFCVDLKDSSQDALVFNRTATLRDSWAKEQKPAGLR